MVTIGMWNAYKGDLEAVKTLIAMNMVSIDDQDAVRLEGYAFIVNYFANFSSHLACPWLAFPQYLLFLAQDGRTMLNYAMIGQKNNRGSKDSKYDELKAFLKAEAGV